MPNRTAARARSRSQGDARSRASASAVAAAGVDRAAVNAQYVLAGAQRVAAQHAHSQPRSAHGYRLGSDRRRHRRPKLSVRARRCGRDVTGEVIIRARGAAGGRGLMAMGLRHGRSRNSVVATCCRERRPGRPPRTGDTRLRRAPRRTRLASPRCYRTTKDFMRDRALRIRGQAAGWHMPARMPRQRRSHSLLGAGPGHIAGERCVGPVPFRVSRGRQDTSTGAIR